MVRQKTARSNKISSIIRTALAAALIIGGVAAAQAATVPEGNKISLNLSQEKLAKALAFLPGNFSIDKDIFTETTVTAKINDATIDEALGMMLSPVGLTYLMEGQDIRIMKQPIVSLEAKGHPFSVEANLVFGSIPYEFTDGADPDFPIYANIKNQQLDQALTSMLRPKGYHWRREAGHYVIYRDREATFNVDLPALQQSFNVASSRAAGGSSSTASSGGSGSSTSGSVSSSSVTSSSNATSKADIASMDNIAAGIKEMLTKEGKITVNKELGLVWVRDQADSVDRIANYIKATNLRFHNAVKISGIITEVSLSEGKELGVDWNFVLKDALSGALTTLPAKMSPTMALQFQWDGGKEKAYINALKSFGDVKVVGRPQLQVINGAIGSLTVGETITYVAQAYTSNIGTSSQTSSLEVQPLQVGLSFYVVPKVIDDREAIIYISPDLTSLQEIRTITNQNLTVEAPHITQKQTQTVVRVKNGEKILISGLMSDTVSKSTSGVPLLMDLPWVGNFFKYTKNSTTKTEFALMLDVSW